VATEGEYKPGLTSWREGFEDTLRVALGAAEEYAGTRPGGYMYEEGVRYAIIWIRDAIREAEEYKP
jgi:hypothetical protein